MVIEDLLSQATCAVIIDNEICGTAWLVSSDGELLTAGHVLGTENPFQKVEVQFTSDIRREAYRIDWGYQKDKGIDFAILKLSSPIPHRKPLPITLAQSVGGKCRLMGFGVSLTDLSGGIGEFGMPTEPQNNPANRLFTLRSDSLCEEGYSGGAVFSDDLQAIVAIQVEAMTQKLGAHRDTVLAMPLYRIAYHWHTLNYLAQQKANNSTHVLQSPFLVSGYFNSLHELLALFNDPRINVWKNGLPPDARNPEALVSATINFLQRQSNRKGDNALVLLAQVMLENLEPTDKAYAELAQFLGQQSTPISAHQPRRRSNQTVSSGWGNYSLSFVILIAIGILVTGIFIGAIQIVLLGGVALTTGLSFYAYYHGWFDWNA